MPGLSHSLPSASSHSSGATIPPPPSASEGGTPPVSLHDPEAEEELQLAPLRSEVPAGDADDEHLRIWTTPDLPNHEYLLLLTIFPSFITRGSPPRFPVPSHPRVTDIEEAEEEREGKEIRYGTGSMWVSAKQRSNGYKGGWWTRLVLWWRRVFC